MLWVDLGWEGLWTSGPSRCLASAGRLLEVAVVNLGQPFDYHLQTVPLTFQECWLLSKVCCFYSLLSECPTPDRSLPSFFALFVVVVVCLLTQTRVIREEEPRLGKGLNLIEKRTLYQVVCRQICRAFSWFDSRPLHSDSPGLFKESRLNKPVSRTPSWTLCKLRPSGFCSAWVPVLTSFSDGLFHGRVRWNKPSVCFWSWSLSKQWKLWPRKSFILQWDYWLFSRFLIVGEERHRIQGTNSLKQLTFSDLAGHRQTLAIIEVESFSF